MNAHTIEIVHLASMRIASAYGFGTNPEEVAWKRLCAWAKPKGYLADLHKNIVLGFNNPYPTAEHPRYGYEFWVKVGAEAEPEGDIRIEEFFGGTYAVARCEVMGHPETNVPAAWQALATWCKEHGHPPKPGHAFERILSSPDDLETLVLELYCPLSS